MKALSIKQPWAWLVCAGYKDIENRNWHIHMPPLLNYPSTPRRIYVHAGKTMDFDGLMAIVKGEFGNLTLKQREYLDHNELMIENMCGAIIGEVDITGCVEESDSPWFVGKYGFTLAKPVLYDKPIPCRGQLGFFEPNIKEADREQRI